MKFNYMDEITLNQLKSAKLASGDLLNVSWDSKDAFLLDLAESLIFKRDEILSANKMDLDLNKNLPAPMVKRLTLTENGFWQ